MQIQYTGIADRRIITEADWTAQGLTQKHTEWNAENGFVVTLNKENGTWLIGHDPEFREQAKEESEES